MNADETSIDCGGQCGCLAEFLRLGFLSSTDQKSSANDVNSDGSVVVGTTYNVNNEARAFRWVAGSGMQPIYENSAKGTSGVAVSSDGLVVAGEWFNPNGQPDQGFTWSKSTGIATMASDTYVLGLSGNGKVPVGSRDHGAAPWGYAAAWGSGAPTLKDASNNNSEARAVSDDGAVVAGWLYGGVSAAMRPALWQQGGVQFLDIPTGAVQGFATAITPNGVSVVGYADVFDGNTNATSSRALIWIQQAGVFSALSIPDLPGGADNDSAQDVSGDGQRVVGWGTTAAGQEAFIWDRSGGTRRLVDELTARGLEGVSALTLAKASAISADGTTIVGAFVNPQGRSEAWRVVLR